MEKTEHSCVPDIVQIDINLKMETRMKRVRKEISVPVNKILEKRISELCEKGSVQIFLNTKISNQHYAGREDEF